MPDYSLPRVERLRSLTTIRRMFAEGKGGFVYFIIIIIGVLLLIIVSMLQTKGSVRLQIKKCSPITRFVIWYGLFLVVLLFGAYGVGYDETQFIYNQF